jgi:hypothetical protein
MNTDAKNISAKISNIIGLDSIDETLTESCNRPAWLTWDPEDGSVSKLVLIHSGLKPTMNETGTQLCACFISDITDKFVQIDVYDGLVDCRIIVPLSRIEIHYMFPHQPSS